MASTGIASKGMTWAGRILSTLVVLFLLMGSVMSIMRPASMQQQMDEGSQKMGWAPEDGPKIGLVLLACVLVYAFPQTSLLGAILLTGYLGGAVATHARIHDPMMVMAIIVGVLVWLGIFLREPRLRSIAFWR